jgi:hypothetical protein
MPVVGGDPKPVIGFLREAHAILPRKRFWWSVVQGSLIGIAVVVPFVYLITRDQTGVGGFLLDSFFELLLPSLLLMPFLFAVSGVFKAPRDQVVRVLRKEFVGVLLLAAMAALFLRGYVNDVRFHLQLYRLAAVDRVQVGCKEISDPLEVDRIAAAIRGARWFSPISHGWSGGIPFTIKLKTGEQLHYFLSRSLSEQAAVILSPAQNPDRATSSDLTTILTQTGIWRTQAPWSDYTHRYYDSVVPESVCPPAENR